MPKYTVTVPMWADATVRHVEGEDPDDALSKVSLPTICAQCSGWGRGHSLDLGEGEFERGFAMEEGEDGEVLAHEYGRREQWENEQVTAENRERQDQARDQRDGRRWRQLLSHLPLGALHELASDLMAEAAMSGSGTAIAEMRDLADAVTDRADDRERDRAAAAAAQGALDATTGTTTPGT